MTEFILAVAFFVGPAFSNPNGVSVSFSPVTFPTKDQCEAAGEKIKSKFGDGAKSASFVCIPRTVAKAS